MPSEATEPIEMPQPHDIVVVGASAGGVEALVELAGLLPAGLPAAVLVVLHMPAYGHSVLPDILSRRGPLPAKHAVNGEPIRTGRIYVAPPDHHLMVRDGSILLTRGPAENNHRPAVDALFRAAARAYGPRAVGIVLTGTLDDGTAGLQSIKSRGGLALVQDPNEALFTGMPVSAIENVAVDEIATIAGLARTVVRLAGENKAGENKAGVQVQHEQAAQKGVPVVSELEEDVAAAESDLSRLEGRTEGRPSGFSCPDCHGVLWEISEGELIRYRCRVGHAFSPQSLLAAQSENLEEALWTALRALEESAAMAERLQARAAERGHKLSAQQFGHQAQDARHRARIVHDVLQGGQVIAESGEYAGESKAA